MRPRNKLMIVAGVLLVAGAIFAAVVMHRGSFVQVLDRQGGGTAQLTLRVMRPFSLDTCQLVHAGERKVVYEPSDHASLSTSYHIDNITPRYTRIGSPLSPAFTSVGDIDSDGVADTAAVCKSQCPIAYDGTHLAFNLSAEGMAYVRLDGPAGTVDLSEGGGMLETSFVRAKNQPLWLFARGSVSSMPYTLNLNEEELRVYTEPYTVPDLDGDGAVERLFVDSSYHLLLSDGDVVTISPTGGVTTLREGGDPIGEVVVEDGGLTCIPRDAGTGTFRAEPLVGSGSVGDVIRLYFTPPSGQEGTLRLVCPSFEEVLWDEV